MNVLETRALKFSFILLISEVLFSCLLWNIQLSNVTLNQELNIFNENLQPEVNSLQSRRLSSSFADELSQCCCVAPTMAPAYRPTVVPTMTPSYVPTLKPTVIPSFTPTFSPSGYAYIRVASSFNGTTGNDYVEIDSTFDIKITGGGGADRYLIVAHPRANITVTDFSNGFNTLDLSNFPIMTDYNSVKSRTTLTDYTAVQSHPKTQLPHINAMNFYRAVISLRNSQFIILENLPDTFHLTDANFAYFNLPSLSPTKSPPDKAHTSSSGSNDNGVTKAAIAAATSVASTLLGLLATWLARKVIAFRIIERWGHTFKICTTETFPTCNREIDVCLVNGQIHCNFSDQRSILLKDGIVESESKLRYVSLEASAITGLTTFELI
jgi:hypothetical protein